MYTNVQLRKKSSKNIQKQIFKLIEACFRLFRNRN